MKLNYFVFLSGGSVTAGLAIYDTMQVCLLQFLSNCITFFLFILYKIIAQSFGRGVNSFLFNLGGGGKRERAGFLKVTAYQRCSWSFMALLEFL